MSATWPPPSHSFLALSTEVRWFLSGPLPAEAARWARTLAGAATADPRTDEYVVIAGAEGLGIKAREGRLEVKTRTAVRPPLRHHGIELGQVEEWAKWSVPIRWPNSRFPGPWVPPEGASGASPLPFPPPPTERRVRIAKTRTLAPVGRGYVEVSDLDVLENSWWSLAVEVWASGPTGDGAVREAAAQLLAGIPGEIRTELSPERSMGYPAFLVRAVASR